jgi:hypothetical protein
MRDHAGTGGVVTFTLRVVSTGAGSLPFRRTGLQNPVLLS